MHEQLLKVWFMEAGRKKRKDTLGMEINQGSK